MSVIVTEMDMPKNCSECKFTYLDTAEIAFFGTNSERCSYNNSMICYDKRRDDCPLKSVNRLIEKLEEQKSKTGHWIKEKSICSWDGYSYQCSVCGRSIHLDIEVEDLEDYPYCHCGAKMESEEEEFDDNLDEMLEKLWNDTESEVEQ